MPKPKAQKRAEAEARNAVTPPERRKAARRQCPTGLIRYASEDIAKRELVGCIVARNGGKNQRREQRWFGCPRCDGYHLSAQPLRRRESAD